MHVVPLSSCIVGRSASGLPKLEIWIEGTGSSHHASSCSSVKWVLVSSIDVVVVCGKTVVWRIRRVPIDVVREALWDGIMREGGLRRKSCAQRTLDPRSLLLPKGLHHSKAPSTPVLWGWRPGSLNTKGSQVAVGSPPVDDRRGIDARPHRRIRVPEGNKSVALGSAGVLVGDDDGLEDLPKLLEVLPHGLLLRLPRQPPHEHLGVGRVPELPHHARRAHGDAAASRKRKRLKAAAAKDLNWARTLRAAGLVRGTVGERGSE